ncbi:MAG: nucleotidyltransferase domain-containing protein [Arcobacter sp.]|nr:nucleotidyltransferase domain-containing protein [Arcobacter sp.]
MLKNQVTKKEILDKLKELKPLYSSQGIEILGLFGSYARNEQDYFSDIDIAYKLDYEKLSKYYKTGFEKILKLDDIKNELQEIFKKNIDFVSDKNKKLLKDIIYV